MEREVLPNRRRCNTFKRRLCNASVFIMVGYYNDGRPGEVFIETAKAGSDLKGMLHTFAMTVSIALQFGAPIKEFAKAMRHVEGVVDGIVDEIKQDGEHREISDIAQIVFDCLLQPIDCDSAVLEESYDTTIGQVYEPKDVTITDTPKGGTFRLGFRQTPPPHNNVEGVACKHCGSFRMQRNGTCLMCLECGETTGCS